MTVLVLAAAAAAAPLGIDANATITKFIELGHFAAGAVLGTLLCWGTAWWCGRERAERSKLETAHFKTLNAQLKLKEERIDELHKMLTKMQQERMPKP